MRLKQLSFVIALANTLIIGCSMDLATGDVVTRPRVVGVRTVIENDATRAWPRAGENVSLQWSTVSDTAVEWSSSMIACVAAASNFGIPSCEGGPFAIQPPTPLSPMSPQFDFTTPADLREGADILVLGILCGNGMATLNMDDNNLYVCEGEQSQREVVLFRLSTEADGRTNRHPSWEGQAFTLDGQPWAAPPEDLPNTGCADTPSSENIPHVQLQDEETPSVFGFTTNPADQETFEELILGETVMYVPTEEELTISHLGDAGRFRRSSTVVFDADSANNSVEWNHPDPEETTIPSDGLTVRFWWPIRDERGGFDRTERALCLIP